LRVLQAEVNAYRAGEGHARASGRGQARENAAECEAAAPRRAAPARLVVRAWIALLVVFLIADLAVGVAAVFELFGSGDLFGKTA
jgi:hypothetical protein